MSNSERSTAAKVLTSAEVSDWFAENVAAEFHKFDPVTGRFMEGEGWAVTLQDIMLCMAYVYKTDYPGNRLYQDAQLLEKIGRTGDALRDFQYPDGKVEFVKVDGSKWGPIYMPWSMYHWLETYRMMEADLDDSRLARWREGLLLAYEGIDREMRESLARLEDDPTVHVVHNIPTWDAMALHRAAQVFHRQEWQQTGETMIRLTLEAQHEDGFWAEHHGPTTLYNTVYIHALGLYHRHNGEIDVLPAMEKALRFHERFTYPDGAKVETVDGRTKYHAEPSPMGLVGLTLVPRGEAYARSMIQLAIRQNVRWKGPHMADLLQYWNVQQESASEEQSLFEQDNVAEELACSIMVKQQGWYACLSAFAAKKVESRWGQDRQSFIGIWQEKSGLIVGGGNSKEQPEWSTFELKTADGGHYYVPDAGQIDLDKREAKLTCGPRTLSVRLQSIERDRLQLEFDADVTAGDEGVVHIPLKLHLDHPIRSDAGQDMAVTDQELVLSGEQGRHNIRHGNWQLEIDGPYRLEWPSYPFNPYAADGAAHLEEAVAVLTLPLGVGTIRTLSIVVV